MKYYYTDPLEAAYMAKHFGVRFEAASFELLNLINEFEPATIVYVSPEQLADSCEQEIKAYIHPDSLHMLEPQVGDVIQFNYPEPDDFQTLMVVKNGNSAAVYEQGIEIRYSDDIEYRIIQRNGIAFMWPESE